MSKMSKTKADLKKLVANLDTAFYAAVDTHKDRWHVCVWGNGKSLRGWHQPSSPEVLLEFVKILGPSLRRLVYEAGPTGFGLARYLRSHGVPVMVISPAHTPERPAGESKSDRLDALRLAEYCAKDLLHPVYIPTEQEETDREVVRRRNRVSREVAKCRARIKSFLLQHSIDEPEGLKNWSRESVEALKALKLNKQLRWLLDEYLDELDHQRARLRKCEAQVRALSRTVRHRDEVKRMTRQRGVGIVTAMTYRTELARADRFANRRAVGRFWGLSPEIFSSGKTRREKGRAAGGNPWGRHLLIEASWSWVNSDSVAGQLFERLLRNTGSKKKAIMAMARRLAIKLWRLNQPIPDEAAG